MNKPELLGVEVLTPDGRGSILSLHTKKVVVHLNKREYMQVMKGIEKDALHYAYDYEDVHVIKGQYCFDDKRIDFQYSDAFAQATPVGAVLFNGSQSEFLSKLTPDNEKALKNIKRPNKS